MKIIDVNVLIYVINRETHHHATVLRWWTSALNDEETLGLPWIVISGFLRITTNPRLLDAPLPIDVATARVDEWLARPNVKLVAAREDHWNLFRNLLRETGAGGNRTTDAHLAAMAVNRDATLISCDGGFAAYRQLRWENPIV